MPMSPPIRLADFAAAIVDLDGTLVDTAGDFRLALNRMLGELDLSEVGHEFITLAIGKGSEHLIRRTLAHTGGDAALYDEAFARYQQHYGSVNGDASDVFPGVREGLVNLRAAGLRLACLTNKPTLHARNLLAIKGLDGFFEVVHGGDSFERKKPDPLPILKTCEALGSAPAHTLVVGDSSNDARAARAAGCKVVLVSYGYNHGEPVDDAGADGVVGRIDDLR